jgi:pimeloyl-[acyl-carrier protein] synthase
MTARPVSTASPAEPPLSLSRMLDPDVLADPYPLYERLRTSDPVHWDPWLHAWVVSRHADCVAVLRHCSAARMPGPEQLSDLDLAELNPIARVLVRQMIFLDPPAHTRLRTLAAKAFTPARVAPLHAHIQEITDSLIDAVLPEGRMDVIAGIASPLPVTVTCEFMGVPASDGERLKGWSVEFSEMLGNFQHNPGRARRMLEVVEGLTGYFRDQMRRQRAWPRDGVLRSLMEAESGGDRFSEEEVIANAIITMVGGQETTTNLIGNGFLALLRNPGQMARLRDDPELAPSAVEELLRYESPVQQTARLAPDDFELAGKRIRRRQAVISVLGAANRDPSRFFDPDRLDLGRSDNQHLAFGWAIHYCFGAALARMEGQIVLGTMLRRLRNPRLDSAPLVWRNNTTFRGLESLPVSFEPE